MPDLRHRPARIWRFARTVPPFRPRPAFVGARAMAAGFGSAGLAIDQETHKVYATGVEDTHVSIIDGTTCNGFNTNDAFGVATAHRTPSPARVDPPTRPSGPGG